MNVRKIHTKCQAVLALALAAFVLCPSCKKENTSEDTRKYLDGVMLLTGTQDFIEAGQPYVARVSGISHPEGGAKPGHRLGLYYSVPGLTSSYDTVYRADVNPLPDPVDVLIDIPEFENTDSLATFTVSITIYAEDSDMYYSSSRSHTVTTVDFDRSIPELAFDESLPYIEDDRCLMPFLYNYTEEDIYGNPLPRAWLTRNMAYMDSGKAYDESEDMSYLFGRFYTYDEALDACPDGWRLPSDQDWADLANSIAGEVKYSPFSEFEGFARHLKVDARFNGSRMWNFWPASPCSGTSGLRVIPAGYCNADAENEYSGYLEYACFWTSDENPDDTSQAFFRYIYTSEDNLKIGSADKKSMAMSVRCVAQ